MDAIRWAAVHHDMAQGFVLTQYFYEQMIQFEKGPASLRDTIGEMVYGMDIEQQVHRARDTDFDQQTDADVLQRSKPRPLTGLDLAENRLEAGDVATASVMVLQTLRVQSDTLQSAADNARANFILARAANSTGHPEQAIDRFQKTLATSKDPRLLAWSHIYLGRMLDLDCKRDAALAEYKEALANRDGAQQEPCCYDVWKELLMACSRPGVPAPKTPTTMRPALLLYHPAVASRGHRTRNNAPRRSVPGV